jgi:hypothetical protein
MEGVGEEAMDWWQRRTGVGGPEVAAAGVGRGPAAAGVGMMRMVFFCEWNAKGEKRKAPRGRADAPRGRGRRTRGRSGKLRTTKLILFSSRESEKLPMEARVSCKIDATSLSHALQLLLRITQSSQVVLSFNDRCGSIITRLLPICH